MNTTNTVKKADGSQNAAIVASTAKHSQAWINQALEALSQGQSLMEFASHAHPSNRPQARKAYLAAIQLVGATGANARLIVASVNHAQALADALKPFAFSAKGEMHDDAEVYRIGNWNVYGRDVNAAKQALAAWEGAQS